MKPWLKSTLMVSSIIPTAISIALFMQVRSDALRTAAIESQIGQLRSQLATQATPAPLLPRLANEVRDAARKSVSLPVVSVGAAKAD
jgi:hypothetical protein